MQTQKVLHLSYSKLAYLQPYYSWGCKKFIIYNSLLSYPLTSELDSSTSLFFFFFLFSFFSSLSLTLSTLFLSRWLQICFGWLQISVGSSRLWVAVGGVGRRGFVLAWVAIGGWFYSLWDCGLPWVGGFPRCEVMGFAHHGSCVFRFGGFWSILILNN